MKKIISLLTAMLLLVTLLAACTDGGTDESGSAAPGGDSSAAGAEERTVTEKTSIRIGGLKGPTSIGMVKLMEDDETGEAANDYEFTVAGSADELTPLLIQGKLDMAAIPANLASVLYNRTEGAIEILAVNTLGVLYIVETGDSVQSLADLRGKTVYATGKGSTPEYTLLYLLEKAGLDLLVQAGRDAGLPVVTEITDISQLDLLADVDVLQVGARNMQNYALLKALGQLRRPVLLKRGLSATVEEFLLAAEYLLSGGNEQVILCERGVRSGVSAARAALDVSAIPVLKRATHLPVLVDPSHAAGRSELVLPLALAAAAAGADGLMVEVHDRPACALSDGGQSLTCRQFRELSAAVTALLPYAWRPDTF